MQGMKVPRSWHLVSIGKEDKAKRVLWKVHALDLDEGRISQKHMHVRVKNLLKSPKWACWKFASLGLQGYKSACRKSLLA